MTTNQPTNSNGHKSHRGVFIAVFLLLCGLTGLSFWVANSWIMDDPIVGWTVMVGISVCKAMLVISFFMHLWWERAWKYALTIPTMFMGGLLVVLLIPDVGLRTDHYSSDRQRMGPESRPGSELNTVNATESPAVPTNPKNEHE